MVHLLDRYAHAAGTDRMVAQMKPKERDELLIRIDERVDELRKSVPPLRKRITRLEILLAAVCASGGISIGVLT